MREGLTYADSTIVGLRKSSLRVKIYYIEKAYFNMPFFLNTFSMASSERATCSLVCVAIKE